MKKRKKRNDTRLGPGCLLKVTETLSGAELGYAVNISPFGFQVTGTYPIDTNTGDRLALEMTFSAETDDQETTLAMSACGIWLKREPTPGVFATGFEIIAMDDLGWARWNAFVSKRQNSGEETPTTQEAL